MDTFLQSASLHLTKVKANDRIHVVLGNEACDLDSVVSAIVYAYFIHKGNTKPGTLIVPVLNIFRREFHLRPDVNHFLGEIRIKPEQLIFRDNIDLKNLSSSQRLSITLVDHNILQREDRELFPLVEEVIDHHHKEVDYDLNKCKVIIERVGSNCTLIGEKLFKELPGIFDNNIALLLYGTILLDTYCLREEAKRVTSKDKEIVEKLEAILGFNERDKLFNKLQNWKNDVSGMSLMDLLRKDVKIISNNTMRIAVSSVPILLENLLKESKSEQDLRNFVTETSSQILVIMGISIDNNASEKSFPIRQIAVFSNHQSYLEQIVDLLEDASLKGPTLRLSHLETSIPKVNLYNQANIAASRKAVLPLLNSFLVGRPPLLSIGSHDGPSASSSENPANRRPTPEGRNEEDEVANFDPLAAESEDLVLDSVGSALAHLHVMGIGDPISHAGSSQSSSNQNSCPYTPQNSCCDGGISEDPYARQILPSFNSREMMEKIESKRGKLRGYVGDGEGDASTTSYPFTPKNSFVDGGFDNYIRGTSNDSGDFMLQVNDRVARINAKRTEPDGAGSSNSKPMQNGSVGSSSGGGGNDIEPLTPERNPEGKDNNNCPEGTSSSDKLDKSDCKMDISETSNSSEKTSPIIDIHHYATTPQLNKFTDENQAPKSNELRKTSSDFNTNNANHVSASSRTDSTISMSSLHDDLDLPSNYLTETVDFPDSPQQLKLMQRSTNGFQNLTEDSWMDQHEDEMLRNVLSPENEEFKSRKERPSSLNTGGKKKRKIKVNPDILNTSDEHDDKSLSSLSNRSDGEDIISPSLDDIVTPDDIATPDVLDDSVFSPRELIPEMSAAEERDDDRRWRTCVIGGVQQKIDLKVIEPYKKVLSHGGYCGPNRSAIIVFCACYLPDHGRKDYDYVMDHLFLYVLTTLDQLVAEDYYLVYLHGALEKSNMPTFGWLKRCYTMIDRRLRKNLKGLYLVHPTFWLKTIVLMTKPFISTKFARKLQFVNSLQDLFDLMPVDQMSLPDKVKQLDFKLMIRTKKKQHKGDSTLHRTNNSSEPASSFEKKEEVDSDAPYRKAHSENQEFTGGWL